MDPFAIAAAVVVPAAILYSWVKKAPLSLSFAVAIIGIFLLASASDLVQPGRARFVLLDLSLSKFGASYSPPWTWITSMFTHFTFAHLALNLIFLIALATMVEDRIGRLRFGLLYFAGGLFASGVFVLLHLPTPAYILLGSSGALSAVFGAFGRLYPYERIRLWLLLVTLPPLPVIHLVIGFVALQLLLSLFLPGIAWEAHLGGVAFGFALAPAVVRVRGAARVQSPPDFAALKPLALTPDLKEAYEQLEGDTPVEARRAWLERFVTKARCPRCGGPLRLRGSRLSSTCGWKLRL